MMIAVTSSMEEIVHQFTQQLLRSHRAIAVLMVSKQMAEAAEKYLRARILK
jgi:hypothetical protein